MRRRLLPFALSLLLSGAAVAQALPPIPAAQDLPYPPPLAPQVPPAVLERGRVLVQRGDVARNIPACVA